MFSQGLVRDAEGNLSVFDGRSLTITKTGASLAAIGSGDLVTGTLHGELPRASTDLEIHRGLYRERGPGAVVHAHPAGTVSEGLIEPGRHGVYAFGPSLKEAVRHVVEEARSGRVGSARTGPGQPLRPVEWLGDRIRLLDQTVLPLEERYVELTEPRAVARAIRRLVVRGAPLLGIVAAYGVCLAATQADGRGNEEVMQALRDAGAALVASRPTAVNIGWAVRRVLQAAEHAAGGPDAVLRAAVAEAARVAAEDEASCLAIGRLGATLVPPGANVLTLCNTGSLATGGIGTAQGIIWTAHDQGRGVHVWICETRPLLQGARLTAWELGRLGIPMTLIADSAAAGLMAAGSIDVVIVGADRIAMNGDVANKVGTYALALAAAAHGIPFFVAAPLSTLDPATPSGDHIVIERRKPEEVTEPLGMRIAPVETWAINPAFDVTPARLITAVVTERGVVHAPLEEGLRALAEAAPSDDPADRVAP